MSITNITHCKKCVHLRVLNKYIHTYILNSSHEKQSLLGKYLRKYFEIVRLLVITKETKETEIWAFVEVQNYGEPHL